MAVSSVDSSEGRVFGSGARPGDVVAERYRVVGELGAGGMGQVLEVEHLELEKRFALKLIRPDRWDATLEARFRREARALARVVSPRVAQVTDFGVDQARGPFYVMELLEGETLSDLIDRQGPLPRDRALTLAIGIAAALHDVHEAGIVHRDVKPGNIGIAARGPVEVRLLDFGLATSTDPDFVSKITESHKIVGSLPYMAPEQFHAEKPTPRVDVWALGIVLYEMLTGALPFDAPSTAALIHQVLSEDVPLDAPAPRTCARAFEGLLAKEAKARPADASEALALLEDVLANPTTAERAAVTVATVEATRVDPGPPPVDRRPRLVLWGVGLALLGAVATGASFVLLFSPAPSEEAPPAQTVGDAPLDPPAAPPTAAESPPPIGTRSMPAPIPVGESEPEPESITPGPAPARPAGTRRVTRRAAPRRPSAERRAPEPDESAEPAEGETPVLDTPAPEGRTNETPADETPVPETPAEPAWTGDIIELAP